jgi:hypothetical protein
VAPDHAAPGGPTASVVRVNALGLPQAGATHATTMRAIAVEGFIELRA